VNEFLPVVEFPEADLRAAVLAADVVAWVRDGVDSEDAELVAESAELVDELAALIEAGEYHEVYDLALAYSRKWASGVADEVRALVMALEALA
jgi:hypothetical protein